MLRLEDVELAYGSIKAVRGVSLHVEAGEVVSIIGANGAGKTTLLRSICRLVSTKGELRFDGESIAGRPPTAVIRKGIATVPQGRGTPTDLSVEDNLRAGAYLRKDRGAIGGDIEHWYGTFPRLGQRRRISAGSLSGGEQQMLAVARTLMGNPLLVLLDEPSEGVAPLIVEQMAATIVELKKEGMSILLSEQNVHFARLVADRVYVLEKGEIRWQGSMAQLDTNQDVQRAYLTV